MENVPDCSAVGCSTAKDASVPARRRGGWTIEKGAAPVTHRFRPMTDGIVDGSEAPAAKDL